METTRISRSGAARSASFVRINVFCFFFCLLNCCVLSNKLFTVNGFLNCSLEYDACTRDIAELRWHLRVNGDRTRQVRNTLKQAEMQNHRLLEKIEFVKTQRPLLKEKMHLEHGNTKRIESARTEVRTTELSI